MAIGRSYDISARQEASRQTRATILDVAIRLLTETGYQAMTIHGLAKAAEVSPQTVYNLIGSKADVLKAAYDVALAGDDEAVPMSERPEFLALRTSRSPRAHAASYAALSRHIYERVGPLLANVLDNAGADPALSAFVATIEAERRTGNSHMVRALAERHGLPRGISADEVVDRVWVLTAPDVADRLVRRRGWTADAYERWLADHLALALTGRR